MSSAALRGVKVQIKTPRHNVRAPTFKVKAFSERDKVSDWRTKQVSGRTRGFMLECTLTELAHVPV